MAGRGLLVAVVLVACGDSSGTPATTESTDAGSSGTPTSTLDETGTTFLGCTTVADCSATEVVCLPRPEPFTKACLYLDNILGCEGSDSMCA